MITPDSLGLFFSKKKLNHLRNLKYLRESNSKQFKAVRSNRGGEFMSSDFKELCDKHGIKREYTMPGTPQQNGVVERKNRTIQQMARSMMNEKNIGQTYWVEAVEIWIPWKVVPMCL
jgi:hypothetical protein